MTPSEVQTRYCETQRVSIDQQQTPDLLYQRVYSQLKQELILLVEQQMEQLQRQLIADFKLWHQQQQLQQYFAGIDAEEQSPQTSASKAGGGSSMLRFPKRVRSQEYLSA